MTEETAPAPVADTAPPAPAPAAPPAQDWRTTIPEDLRGDPNFAKYETAEGFYKGHLSLVKMLGSEKVAIPKDGDQEGWDRWYKAAGVPDAPDAYGFKAPETVPEGMQYNPDLDKQIAGIFHGAKLDPRQAAKVREGLMEIVGKGATDSLDASKQAEAARQLEIQKGEEALKGEWGTAFEQRGKVAGAAINKFLSPETIAALESARLANNPAIVKDMYNLGVKLAGEKELIGAGEVSLSPGDLDASIADFRAKHQAALFDRGHPDHAQRQREFTALFEKRYPEKAA